MARNLTILAYHRVLDAPDMLRPGDMTLECFKSHMRMLARFFNVLPLVTGVHALQDGTLPSRAISITFDDGYADNHSVALPVLRKFNLPATIFVATGFLDGGRMWNDTVIESIRHAPGGELNLDDLGLGRHALAGADNRRAAVNSIIAQLKYIEPEQRTTRTAALAARIGCQLPDDIMLTSEQVRELSRAGIEIGAHTVTHPILKSLDDDTARGEIVDGKRHLEEIVGRPVRCFAYPNGKPGVDYDRQHARIVRDSGFDCAVATCSGAARASDDPFELPRFGPWTESPLKFGIRCLRMSMR